MATVEGSHAGRVTDVAGKWSTILGVSKDFVAARKDGLLDLPIQPVWHMPPMGPVPQTAEDLAFGRADLKAGCGAGFYRKVMPDKRADLICTGNLISSSFFLWQGEGGIAKGGSATMSGDN